MKKEKITQFLKDYQGYVIALITVTITLIGTIIKPIRLWLIKVLNTVVPLRLWSLLVIILLTVLIVYLINLLKRRNKHECKFKMGSAVQNKGYSLKMTVVEYKPYKNLVLCSWMNNKEHYEKWYNQNVLEEYVPFDYPIPRITTRKSNNRY